MEVKPSSLPWSVNGKQSIRGENGEYIAKTNWRDGAYHADFIVKACNAHYDLLEALEWMVENDETNQGDVPMPERGGQTWDEINAYWIDGLNRAKAAITKAKGEKP